MNRYKEAIDEQCAYLHRRFASVNDYLDAASDNAEASRKALWQLPDGVTVDSYASFIEPRRLMVREMLGYPPPGEAMEIDFDIKQIGEDDDGVYYRASAPILKEGLETYGILMRPREVDPAKDLAVVIHGGGGTPELAAELMFPSNYHDFGRLFLKHGHLVWMPACYESTSFDPSQAYPFVHDYIDLKARLIGTTNSAIDLFGIIAGTQAMIAHENIASGKAISCGLSYGGFRSLAVSAISDIFSACICSGYFNDRRSILNMGAKDRAFMDWFFNNTLGIATDVELSMLVCPRPLFVEFGAKDALFPPQLAIKRAEEVAAVYESLGIADRFGFDAFDGDHEFSGVKAVPFIEKALASR